MAQEKEKKELKVGDYAGDFVATEINDRLFADSLAKLAVELAKQVGEEVKRPLSQEQLARALDVNAVELDRLMGLLEERWHRRRLAGDLPDGAIWKDYS